MTLMRHADGCELQHDRELGECTCYLAERAERDFLRDRIATLEAALRPFAANAHRFGNPVTDAPEACIADGEDIAAIGFDEVGVTAADMRRAATALAQPGGGGS